MAKSSRLLIFVAALWLWLAGCGGGRDASQVTFTRAPVGGGDVATALGLGLLKFEVEASREVRVDVRFWVEEHVRSGSDTVTQTHVLAQWSGEYLSGHLLVMLPWGSPGLYHFGIGASGITSRLPDSIQSDVGTGAHLRVSEKINFQLGETIILAAQVYSDETTGASTDDIRDFVEENIRMGKYKRILVYKATFTPTV